jgi:hypothetical protein
MFGIARVPPTYASAREVEIPSDMDVAALQQEIIQSLNGDGYGLSRIVTENDVDFTKAYKVYVGVDVFSLETIGHGELKAELEKVDGVFMVPVYMDDQTFLVTVSRKPPFDHESVKNVLTEDEIARQESRVGTWVIPVISTYEDAHFDYYDIAAKRTGIYDRLPLLVGGLPYFHYPVAIYPDDEGNLATMTVINPATAPWETLGIERPGEDAEFVFDYEYVKEKVNSAPPEGGDMGGVPQDASEEGTAPPPVASFPSPTEGQPQVPAGEVTTPNVPLVVAIAAAAVAVAVVAVALLFRRKSHRQGGEQGEP